MKGVSRKSTKEDKFMDVAREDAERTVEGYRRGVHTCKECGRVSISLSGCKAFRDKVRSLLSKEVPDFKEGGLVDGYCPDCQWDKFGIALDITVIVSVVRCGEESPSQTVERVKARLERLGGLPFTIEGFRRVHTMDSKWNPRWAEAVKKVSGEV